MRMIIELLVLVSSVYMAEVGLTVADDTCPGLPMCFCNKEKTSVNCNGKHLTNVPDNIPNSVEKLYLGYNDFINIPTHAFASLTKLEKLWLQNNKITTIEPFAFENLSSLSYLDIRGNKLVTIGKNAFSGLERLSQLFLLTNQIQTVHDEAFTGTESLTYISIQSNMLKAIPPLCPMPNLKRLIMQANSIENATFPQCFSANKQLAYIGLSSNKIKTLTNSTFDALMNNSISSLYLSSNKIEHVEPGAFDTFASIASLKLGSNPLGSNALKIALAGLKGKSIASLDISGIKLNGILLKDTFALLKNTTLTTLNMRYNKIQNLPNEVFSGLNNLIVLDISNCDIQTTSKQSFSGLERLTILNMEKNKLMDVPVNLPTSLNKLFLDDNQITTIKEKVFLDLVFLQELRIQYNKVQTLEQYSFQGLINLNKLSLYNNAIANLPGQVFGQLVRLMSLDLAGNNLISIQDASDRFSSLGNLLYLNLADNNCIYFQTDMFKNMQSLKYLHLENNQLGQLIARDYGGAIFEGLNSLEELYLMDNKIFALPDPTFQSLNSLLLLNVSSNKLAGWGDDLFRSTQKLKGLDLSYNLITTLKKSNMKYFVSMQTINLTLNPFACNCDLRWFRDWINTTSITVANSASYTCSGPKEWAGKTLMSFDRTKINCTFYTWRTIVIACAIVAIIILIIGCLVYRKRWTLKLFLYKQTRTYKMKRKQLQAADGRGAYGAIDVEQKTFDAYISCSEDDKEWVRRHLLPDIDKGQIDDDHKFGGQFSLYFDDRDSEPGRAVVGNIFENMAVSRKVIVVLSRNFLNGMNLFEVDLAVDQVYERKLEEIIVVHIDQGLPSRKVPKYLAATMKRHQMISWMEDADNQQLFKQTLIDRLGVKANAADNDAV